MESTVPPDINICMTQLVAPSPGLPQTGGGGRCVHLRVFMLWTVTSKWIEHTPQANEKHQHDNPSRNDCSLHRPHDVQVACWLTEGPVGAESRPRKLGQKEWNLDVEKERHAPARSVVHDRATHAQPKNRDIRDDVQGEKGKHADVVNAQQVAVGALR